MQNLYVTMQRRKIFMPNLSLFNVKLTLTSLFLILIIGFTNAQVVITEIFSDGTFALTNIGDSDADVSSYWACNFPLYEQLSNLNVECGSLVIPVSYTHLTLPTICSV